MGAKKTPTEARKYLEQLDKIFNMFYIACLPKRWMCEGVIIGYQALA